MPQESQLQLQYIGSIIYQFDNKPFTFWHNLLYLKDDIKLQTFITPRKTIDSSEYFHDNYNTSDKFKPVAAQFRNLPGKNNSKI